MNILIPHAWLLEHLETSATPEEIQTHLSLCGPSIERIYSKEGEPVYDIEVTTNRVDMMSVRGIAREASVILPQFGIPAQLKTVALPSVPTTASDLKLPVITDDQQLCQRIYCVALDAVSQAPTPEWMAKRLRQIDQNVHDSVIDITNYVTHEYGHPCHAFDYDKVMTLGGVIKVTTAKPGQPFKTLDGVAYTTKGGEVIFTNENGEIIDLPAIKGTENTAVDSQTKRVLLWIESISAEKIRAASMSHAIRTIAAQLNEKNVDAHLAEPTMARGVQLYQQLCGAQVGSQLYDQFPAQKQPQTVTVSLDQIHAYLGLKLDVNTIQQVLTDLGCQVDLESDKIIVTPPTFRSDISIPADVIEEIARIYGYHRLPSVIMDTAIPTTKPKHTTFDLEYQLKQFLVGQGWYEVYTYSMVSEALALQSGYDLGSHLKIANPLTDDRVYLRRSLIPSLVEVRASNPQRPDMSVFEISSVYVAEPNDIPSHDQQLCLVTTQGYRKLRGLLETLLESVYVRGVRIQPDEQPAPGYVQSAAIYALVNHNEQTLGSIGTLASGEVAAQLTVNATFAQAAGTHPRYTSIPKTASMIEDLTFTIPLEISVGEVLSTIMAAHQLVVKAELGSIYQRNYTFSITYWDAQRTLSSTDIEPVRKLLVQKVTEIPGVTLVGTV